MYRKKCYEQKLWTKQIRSLHILFIYHLQTNESRSYQMFEGFGVLMMIKGTGEWRENEKEI